MSQRTESGNSRWRHAVDILLLALLFALVTGFIEAGIIVIRRIGFGHLVWVPRHHVWMTPVAYSILFAPAGLLAAAAGAVLPRRTPLFLVAFPFSTAAFMILTLPFGQFSHFATALLALGVGVQVARTAKRRTRGFQRTIRIGAPALSLLITIIALTQMTGGLIGERLRMARLPDAPHGARSVLLIILDTVRASSLALYGGELPNTPNLERWAQRGVVFDRAIATSPWTLPTHASLFTGRWSHELSTDWLLPLDEQHPVLAEVLRDHGYATGAFVANLDYTAYDSGLGRGFTHHADYRMSMQQIFKSTVLRQTGLGSGLARARSPRDVIRTLRRHDLFVPPKRWHHAKPAELVTTEFLDWLDRVSRRPFFAFLNYFDAHTPYRCPPPFAEQFGCGGTDDESTYNGAIAYLDAELDRLFRALDHRGMLEQTIVVVTSDHGEMFGEHGLDGHGHALYLPLLHVPLVLLAPGRAPEGVRVPHTASLRNLAATIMDIATIDDSLPGESLANLWIETTDSSSTNATPPNLPALAGVTRGINNPPHFPISRGDMASLTTDRWHYIRNGDGVEELFEYRLDPHELVDLTASVDAATVLADLRATMASMTRPAATPASRE